MCRRFLSVCVTNTDITYCTDLQCVKGFISLCDHALTCSVSKAVSICVTMHWPPVYQRLYQSVWPCTDLQCVKGFISLCDQYKHNLLHWPPACQRLYHYINLCDHALTSSVSEALSICVTMHWPPVCQRLYQSVWPCIDLQCVRGCINLCDHALTSNVSKALSIWVTRCLRMRVILSETSPAVITSVYWREAKRENWIKSHCSQFADRGQGNSV